MLFFWKESVAFVSVCYRSKYLMSMNFMETGMSGNFLSCSKGVKDPLEVTNVRCD